MEYNHEDLWVRATEQTKKYNSEENVFNMPNMSMMSPVRTKAKPKNIRTTNVRDSLFLTDLIGHINATLGTNLIQVINDDDAKTQTGSYNGYIHEGKVYVNVQSPEHLMHELSHVALAVLKHGSPEQYYQLLGSIKNSPTYKVLDASKAYTHLRGADFLEEVLAHDLGLYLSGQFTK
ncbi:MAG: hypothetical protein J6V44_12375 [Methanobrevibacter sp.]|nr:hypothetical protein [Methanobrevibacter sp.]